jgi:hypothetical protein
MKINKPFGEVIESSLHYWKAQSWQWDYFPAFGSLVTITTNNNMTLFGIVYQIQTGSSDPSRQAFAYQKTEQELKAEQPQIFAFLQTSFMCAPVGFYQSRMYYQLPSTPPKIHAFIEHAREEDIKRFFSHNHYLSVLFGLSLPNTNIDELLLALLKNLEMAHLLTTEKFHDFMQIFSLLTANDYRRLKLFLQRAQYTISLER